MTKRMLIDATHELETRVAIVEDDIIEHFDFISSAKRQLKGNIYLGKITRIEPSLQAAFVEYGGGKQGFLSFSEIHPDYYQIPVADRKRLMEEAQREAEEAEREQERREAEDSDWENEEERESSQDGDVRNQETESPDDGAQDIPEAAEAPEDAQAQEATQESGESAPSVTEGAPQEETGPEADDEASGEEARPAGSRRRRRTFGSRAKQARSRRLDTSSEPIEDGEDGERGRDDIETVSEEDVAKPRPYAFRRYKIQEVIKPNQIVLVQVVKEERGNKGCSLSTYISLPGRYCVLMPNSPKDGGISRKIGNNADRKRLKEIAADLRDARGMSAIIRTAGIDRTRAEIKRDYEYLIKLWNKTRDLALSSTAPALVYEEGDIVKRTIRDYYNSDIDEVLVQGEPAYKSAKDFMKMIMPSHGARVKLFKETQPLFNAYGVEEQLAELYNPIAPLPSGGYLVINPTEALISIDVNSGRSTTERNVEETAYKTNLEAAEEVARQLRLRDLGGLVVVDFIDMGYGKHRRQVERALKDALKSDRAKVQVGHISAFGLMELSRQRLGPSIFESTTIACPHCLGTGHVRSADATAMSVIREIESQAFDGATELRVRLNARDALCLLNKYRHEIARLEQAYDLSLSFEVDETLIQGTYAFGNGPVGGERKDGARRNASRRRNRRGGRSGRGNAPRELYAATDTEEDQDNFEPETEDGEEREADGSEERAEGEERSGRRRSRRGRRGGQRARQARLNGDQREGEEDGAYDSDMPEGNESERAPEAETETADRPQDEAPRPRRSRGGRGRGRGRNRGDDASLDPQVDESRMSELEAESYAEEIAEEIAVTETPSDEPAPAFTPSLVAATPVAAPRPVQEDTPVDDSRPKRKGWWSKITG